jgi:hypothetical protein
MTNEMIMWYVFRDEELLGYVQAPSLYQAKVLAYNDFGNDVIVKRSKTYDR